MLEQATCSYLEVAIATRESLMALPFCCCSDSDPRNEIAFPVSFPHPRRIPGDGSGAAYSRPAVLGAAHSGCCDAVATCCPAARRSDMPPHVASDGYMWLHRSCARAIRVL